MKESIPLPTQDYMVNISCMTYNHEKYIEDALKGFVMQKTNFPFCALVIDDASTDGTADVIRKYENKYPNIIKAIYLKENHYSQKRSKMPYYKPWRERSKYIALCEGDDYWTDPLKLQKQVDFLETNPEYIICSHNYKILNNNTTNINHSYADLTFKEKNNYIYYDFTTDNYFHGWFTQPLTTLYRNHNILLSFPLNKYTYFRDTIFFYYLIKNGKGALLQDIMGVYRKHEGGIFTSQSFFTNQKIALITAIELYINEKDKHSFVLMNQVMYGLICYLKIDKSLFKKVFTLFLFYLKNAPLEAILLLFHKFIKRLYKK